MSSGFRNSASANLTLNNCAQTIWHAKSCHTQQFHNHYAQVICHAPEGTLSSLEAQRTYQWNSKLEVAAEISTNVLFKMSKWSKTQILFISILIAWSKYNLGKKPITIDYIFNLYLKLVLLRHLDMVFINFHYENVFLNLFHEKIFSPVFYSNFWQKHSVSFLSFYKNEALP